MEERAKKIIEACLYEKSKNPIDIFHNIAHMEFVRIHGPEHHVLDGAALLTAYYNAGGKIDLQTSLTELMRRGLQMPGATCGMWGICGAVSSMGAALSIIDGTGPLSSDESWGKHMEFTSNALWSLSQVGGPRCCKRDAFLSFQKAIEYINDNYNVKLESSRIECCFSEINEQCIKERCPFYKKMKKSEKNECFSWNSSISTLVTTKSMYHMLCEWASVNSNQYVLEERNFHKNPVEKPDIW